MKRTLHVWIYNKEFSAAWKLRTKNQYGVSCLTRQQPARGSEKLKANGNARRINERGAVKCTSINVAPLASDELRFAKAARHRTNEHDERKKNNNEE